MLINRLLLEVEYMTCDGVNIVIGNLVNGLGVYFKSNNFSDCIGCYNEWTHNDMFDYVAMTNYDYVKEHIENCFEVYK